MFTSTAVESPARVFETVNSYQKSAALKAGIDIELFTAIADGVVTVPDIARRCGASERGVRILADYLVVTGFLTKQGGTYGLSPDSEMFLNKRSPAYIGSITAFMLSPQTIEYFADLTSIVRRGKEDTETGYVSDANPIWVEFAHSMKPMMSMPAEYAARVTGSLPDGARVLDVAAGHGMFGIMVGKYNPTCQVTGLDWPSVMDYARANAAEMGLDGRYHSIEGSFFEVDLGGPYDVVLIPNFLHHFGRDTNVDILRKVRSALNGDGRAVIVEFVPHEDRVSPPIPAAFSLQMLAGTREGDAYTFGELQQMLGDAGYSRAVIHTEPEMPQSVIVAHP